AQLLNLALEHLPGTRNVRVHGHSRGGAVILQAASERPDLFSQVEVILEAPVLPQGQPYRPSSAISRLLLPSLHLLWQRRPDMLLEQPIWGPLDDPDKRELIRAMTFNPRSSALLLTNVRDLLGWMASSSTAIYRHVPRGAVLVPGRDRVLNSAAMLDSAHPADNLQIVEVPEGSHFVLLDNPESIPPLRNPRCPTASNPLALSVPDLPRSSPFPASPGWRRPPPAGWSCFPPVTARRPSPGWGR